MKHNLAYKLFLVLMSYAVGSLAIIGIFFIYIKYYIDLVDIAFAFIAHIFIAIGAAFIALPVYIVLRRIKPSVVARILQILIIILGVIVGVNLGIKYLS